MTAARAFRWSVGALILIGCAWYVQRVQGQARPEPDAPAPQRQWPAPPATLPGRAFVVPPAPALSPADEVKTFKIAPGYRVELVASEPLVHDPVAITFDPDGRIWVLEMRGFMPDVNGRGDHEPVCTVSVLEDTNGDGVMDKSTLFLGGLVLPRALCWTTGGLLVAEEGKFWYCRDTDGDLKCDGKELIGQYTPGNAEHALNGLMPALDNWIYNAKEGIRLRQIDGKWVRDATVARGQWGISQDDRGYLYYNVNAQLIRGDLIPCYSPSAHVPNSLTNLALYKEQQVWPIRPTTGVNRGYIAGFLRPDGTMVDANADCGPVVYRGDNLPAELRGDVFISEPAGNLIRRQVVTRENGVTSSRNAYDRAEFIASTDERFRPVNMNNAPDGTLYVVDMYRGIIQHGQFMTPYLRQEIIARALDKPIGLGRIWRIAHETTKPRPPAALGRATGAELVAHLSSPNGWTRDTAQQLLVQRGDASVVPELKKLAASGPDPLGRLHALWVLEGLKKINEDVVSSALADKDSAVRSSAVFLARNLVLKQADSPLVDALAPLAKDPIPEVRMQIALTLGLVNTPAADAALEPILKEAATNPALLEPLLAGFSGREVEFLGRTLHPAWAKPERWREQLLVSTANLLWRTRQPLSILRLMHLVSMQPDDRAWQQIALLEGLTTTTAAAPSARGNRARGGLRGGAAPPRVVTLPAAPEALDALRKSPNARLAAAAEAVSKQLNWPGKDGKPLPVLPPLSPKHQALYDLGRAEYAGLCAACHHPAGFGDAGKGPPLLDSEWLDKDERVIRLVLYGLRGPVTINGEAFNRDGVLEMPGMYAALTDEKIAAVLTFVRREWRDGAPPVEPEAVARIRAATAGRTEQWNEKDLLEIK